MKNKTDILDTIGNTPLIEINRVAPKACARILVKLENHNPTGSMKDRMARAVITGAISKGRLTPGGTVVEYTGGSTTKELIQRMIAHAKELSSMPGSFFADQFNNPDAASGYASMAEEIWEQSGRQLDVFVQSVGTAQCITGVARVLRDKNSHIRIIAVEPGESPVLSGGKPGAHKIEGIGPGFIPPIWHEGLSDEIIQISTEDAKAMTRLLAREEALFSGTSTGANILAAIRFVTSFENKASAIETVTPILEKHRVWRVSGDCIE